MATGEAKGASPPWHLHRWFHDMGGVVTRDDRYKRQQKVDTRETREGNTNTRKANVQTREAKEWMVYKMKAMGGEGRYEGDEGGGR